MLVLIPNDIVHNNLTWVESGYYPLVRITSRGYLIEINRFEIREPRSLVQVPFAQARLFHDS